jgi:hypothetical protein
MCAEASGGGASTSISSGSGGSGGCGRSDAFVESVKVAAKRDAYRSRCDEPTEQI